MKIIKQPVQGKLWQAEGRAALLLTDAAPTARSEATLYLCFAVVVQGPEAHILPASVLDDWGNERRDLAVYGWMEDEGHRFPRSEVFGFNPDGTETQCFLRALELYARRPVYVYARVDAPVAAGVLLNAILLPDTAVEQPQKIKPPAEWPRPLRQAAVSWWQVNPALTAFDFSLLDKGA